MLTLISEIIGDHDSRLKLEQRFEEAEPDPGLFPEDTGFDTAALLTPEALSAKLGTSLNSSAYIRHMMVSKFNDLVPLIFSLTPCTGRGSCISQVGTGPEFL